MEMFRFYLFKEESEFVSKFRPVPTIEPHNTQGSCQAPLFKMIYNSNPTKKSLYVLQPVDLTKQYIETYNDTSEFKEGIAQTLGFLPLILVNEIFELLRRRYQQSVTEIKAAAVASPEEQHRIEQDYRQQIVALLGLLYDVFRNSYQSEEICEENVGYMMIMVTDPRLKEEIYTSLNPTKFSNKRGGGASAMGKLYFLGKAAEFFYQSQARLGGQMLASPDTQRMYIEQSPHAVTPGVSDRNRLMGSETDMLIVGEHLLSDEALQ